MKCHTPFRKEADGAEYALPCGKCPPCKLRRIQGWVFRIQEEDKVSSSSYFITLTYDTRHVPISDNGFMTLEKSAYQKFMKRLRKLERNKLKYYAVGEYGTKNNRPHYHAILFNLEDVENIAKSWELGNVHIGEVTTDSIAYTVKYIDKLKRIPIHRNDDRQKEFSLMSKGLGKSYISDAIKKYHRADLKRNYLTTPNGYKVAMPKYYREKIFTEVERETQRDYILDAESKKEREMRRKFDLLYKNSDITYERWLYEQKIGLYHQFYSSQKKIRQ